jgi:hypothetical protein
MSAPWQPSFRDAVTAFVTAAHPSALKPDQVHLLVPAQRWDWEAMLTGLTAAAQIEFCDTMPASCEAGSNYAASSDSFSDAYATFIELLADFSPASLLKAARAALVKPQGDPASTPSPSGWTKTLDGAGMLRWTLDWILATSPSRWLAHKGGGRSASATLDAPANLRLLDDGANNVVAIPTATDEPLSVSGAGWSRVPVYPGSWYSGSTVALGRNGPFEAGRAPTTVVGPAGILRCRVAELIVAERVSVTGSLASAVTAGDVAAATEVQFGPVTADPGDTSLEGSTLTVVTPAGQPYLVGVIYAQP